MGNDLPDYQSEVTTTLDLPYLPLAGGTMSGAINMGNSKVTAMADPTAAQDAATRAYVLAVAALYLALAGGTMSGAIAMGSNKITGLGTPTSSGDAATKDYVDDVEALLDDIAVSQPGNSFDTVYQNTSGKLKFVCVTFLVDAVAEEDDVELKIGSGSPPTTIVDHGHCVYPYHPYSKVAFFVPPSYYYAAYKSGDADVYKWSEATLF